ncbi:enoyl-CoA hydratase/isomerase family protein [Dactylosporangium sucinum]|uniref:Crotonase n=1 Tax=Dactylosporangium sucinum TaxID=1424081 RepID=A0A917TW90_9ACTN|nr:enoyl-CoA hydratase-related protein [Dactylosporangium sucinum]GGM41007.1 crotonase [Dactylosporangium sucinum]
MLLSTVVGRTLVVTLNRPDRANALDDELMDALAGLWDRVARSRGLRAIVLTGAGKAFCAGADAGMLAQPRTKVGDTAADELDFMPGPRVELPVIVAVNGACAGGGLHFVADADICVASTAARFVDPHVSVGQVSALEPLQLRLRMRADVLRRMVLLGRHEVLGAEAAERAGLVSEVVAPDALLDRAMQLAAAVGANSPEAVRLSRRVLRTFEDRLIATDLDLGWELIQRHRAHPDATEGPAAFLAKRDPSWTAS